MLLQVVTFARNVRLHSLARRELDLGDLPLCGIGLLGLRDENLANYAFSLRVALQQRRLGRLDLPWGLSPCSLVQGGRSGQ